MQEVCSEGEREKSSETHKEGVQADQQPIPQQALQLEGDEHDGIVPAHAMHNPSIIKG
jgi:hypothetical protein